MFIPEGFAHGFQALSDDVQLLYFHTAVLRAEHEGGVRFDDPGWRSVAAGGQQVSDRDRGFRDSTMLRGTVVMKCRFCETALDDVFLDLGTAPPSNAFLSADRLLEPGDVAPAQAVHLSTSAISFRSMRSSITPSCSRRTTCTSRRSPAHGSLTRSGTSSTSTERLGLGPQSLVVETASNDGYLLRFMKARNIPCVGIEPTSGTAEAAKAIGIETIERVLWRDFAQNRGRQRVQADLIIANNVSRTFRT